MGWLLNEHHRFYAIVWIEGWVPSLNSIFFLIICRCFVGCIWLYWRLQNFIVPQLTSIQIVKLLSIFPISYFFPYIMEILDHIFIGVSNENLQQIQKPNRLALKNSRNNRNWIQLPCCYDKLIYWKWFCVSIKAP